MKQLYLSIMILTSCGTGALATSFYLSPDVPTDDPSAGSPVYLASEIVRNDSGTYGSTLLLPESVAVDAVHRLNDGDWLFSVDAPAELPPGSGTVFDPRDVIRYDGSTFGLFLDGAAAGIPVGSQVDALFLDGEGVVLSFDVPTSTGGATYDPADLVRHGPAGFSVYLDASSTTPPIPTASNVTGADLYTAGLLLLTFDTPTTLGGTTFLPGELVRWTVTSGFARFHSDAAWPLSSRVDALSMPPAPGTIPPTLRVGKSSSTPGNLTLTWEPSCSAGGESFGIYEGTIGSWYSHSSIQCAIPGFSRDVTPSSGSRYYLVVPKNPNLEGSYGRDWSGAERPRGVVTACAGTQDLETCP